MKAGDWVLVCSDGVTNHVTNDQLKEMMHSEAGSAEIAARRLVNLTNIEGATDNATVVVIRATSSLSFSAAWGRRAARRKPAGNAVTGGLTPRRSPAANG